MEPGYYWLKFRDSPTLGTPEWLVGQVGELTFSDGSQDLYPVTILGSDECFSLDAFVFGPKIQPPEGIET